MEYFKGIEGRGGEASWCLNNHLPRQMGASQGRGTWLASPLATQKESERGSASPTTLSTRFDRWISENNPLFHAVHFTTSTQLFTLSATDYYYRCQRVPIFRCSHRPELVPPFWRHAFEYRENHNGHLFALETRTIHCSREGNASYPTIYTHNFDLVLAHLPLMFGGGRVNPRGYLMSTSPLL